MTSLYVELGTSLTWKLINKIVKKEDLELQAYKAINDTFKEYYSENQFEYDEDIVMTSFIQTLNEYLADFNFESLTLKVISDTTGQRLEEKEFNKWIQIFKKTCSHPKYKWLYNRIMFDKNYPDQKNRDNSWMKKYMKENYCKLSISGLEMFPRIFDEIQTTLLADCWYDTQVLLYEIIYNSQKHGKAKNCKLRIKESSISIFDNGAQFNPKTLLTQEGFSGGIIAIKHFCSKHPEVSLKYEYLDGNNIFVLSFNDDVFDINILSEILVPSLFPPKGIYHLKYVNSVFKYYYIDIDEVAALANGELRASYSGIIGLFLNVYHTLLERRRGSKVFIFFSNVDNPSYHKVFEMMNDILNENIDLMPNIHLVKNN